MTIEEMIKLLDVTRREWSAYVDGFDPNEHAKFDQIIAALRAGQEMREDLKTVPSVTGVVHISNKSGAQAWDTITAESDFNLIEYAEARGLTVEPSVYCYRVQVKDGTLFFNPRLSRQEQLKYGKPVVDAATKVEE